MNTQDLIDLADSMKKVLLRLRAIDTRSGGTVFVPRADAESLAARMQDISADPKGQEVFDFAFELEDMGIELEHLLSQDVQFHS